MHAPSIRDRWLASICYLSILVIVPILSKRRSTFLAAHCRSGFSLVFAQIVLGILVWVIESAFGLVPFLGVLVGIVLHLAYWLVFIALSVLGFVRALSGEEFSIPGLDEFANKVPIYECNKNDSP